MTAAPIPTLSAGTPSTRPVAPLRLVWLHLRFQILETVRTPIALFSAMLFPALSLTFFVLPQQTVAQDPLFATMAVASLAIFAVFAANLFTYGMGVAEDRSKPFDPFVRTLPAGPGPRMAGRIGTGALMSLISLAPLILVAWLLTAATVTLTQLLAGVGVLLAAGVPFLLLGMAVGYSLPVKAAVAVVQMLLIPLAFLGGLFLPPMMFPTWLDTVSRFAPTRPARDLLVEALTGTPAYGGAWLVLIGWAVVFGALAVWAYRRDEGRRFR